MALGPAGEQDQAGNSPAGPEIDNPAGCGLDLGLTPTTNPSA